MTNLFMAVCTAYCACTKCCGPHAAGITASGKTPVQGITIAASRSIPLGTRVEINRHVYIVEDRLAKKFDNRFDIYFSRHEDAKRYGIRTNFVTILGTSLAK